MADSYIEKGPIIEYVGTGHLYSIRFFLKYPQYAMEVVLRTVNELMTDRINTGWLLDFFKRRLPQIYKVFENPNWTEIIKEIFRLVFKKPEGYKLINYPIDFLSIYGIE